MRNPGWVWTQMAPTCCATGGVGRTGHSGIIRCSAVRRRDPRRRCRSGTRCALTRGARLRTRLRTTAAGTPTTLCQCQQGHEKRRTRCLPANLESLRTPMYTRLLKKNSCLSPATGRFGTCPWADPKTINWPDPEPTHTKRSALLIHKVGSRNTQAV